MEASSPLRLVSRPQSTTLTDAEKSPSLPAPSQSLPKAPKKDNLYSVPAARFGIIDRARTAKIRERVLLKAERVFWARVVPFAWKKAREGDWDAARFLMQTLKDPTLSGVLKGNERMSTKERAERWEREQASAARPKGRPEADGKALAGGGGPYEPPGPIEPVEPVAQADLGLEMGKVQHGLADGDDESA